MALAYTLSLVSSRFFFGSAPASKEHLTQATRVNENGEVVLAGPAPYYSNRIEEFQTFDLDVYVNTYNSAEFFGSGKLRQPKIH